MAVNLRELQRHKEAKDAFRGVVERSAKVLGLLHHDALKATMNYAILCNRTDKTLEAEVRTEQRSTAARSLGVDNPYTLRTAERLFSMLCDLNRLQGALKITVRNPTSQRRNSQGGASKKRQLSVQTRGGTGRSASRSQGGAEFARECLQVSRKKRTSSGAPKACGGWGRYFEPAIWAAILNTRTRWNIQWIEGRDLVDASLETLCLYFKNLPPRRRKRRYPTLTFAAMPFFYADSSRIGSAPQLHTFSSSPAKRGFVLAVNAVHTIEKLSTYHHGFAGSLRVGFRTFSPLSGLA